MNSGLAEQLVSAGKLVPFSVRQTSPLVLELKELPFITYPYEWSFGQFKAAAELTLSITLDAMKKGMILKDASAYNIAFHKGRAIFLDHTSFTVFQDNMPWVAYRQFVMHFLASLLLMQKKDLRLSALMQTDISGIPLDLASHLLPLHTVLSPEILIHIHLHAALEKRYSSSPDTNKQVSVPRKRLECMLNSMLDYIKAMKIPGNHTGWAEYTENTSYSRDAIDSKKALVRKFCEEFKSGTAVDLGANSGIFTAIAAEYFPEVIAVDSDPLTVESLYQLSKTFSSAEIHPVKADLCTPSPGIGCFNEERTALLQRLKGDFVLGLALIHHLRITGNWSLEQIVSLFSDIAPAAVVEFVPSDDPQVVQLLRGRENLCPDWNIESVTAAFKEKFASCEAVPVADSRRILLKLQKS